MDEYEIVFTGDRVEGVSHEEVRDRLMQVSMLDKERVDDILSRRNVVLERGMSKEQADYYAGKFYELGMIVAVELFMPFIGPVIPDRTE